MSLKEREAIETNVEKKIWKSSIALGDIASWMYLFLKIVTKWREIQQSKLNNSLTNYLLKIFHIVFYRVELF